MDVVDAAPTRVYEGIDLDRFRLRAFVESLVGTGELTVRDEPTELTDVARLLEGVQTAVWLRQVGPERAELVGSVVASRERVARAFGVPVRALLAEVLRRTSHRQEIVELPRGTAPVQEVVLTGDDADLTALPVHLQHEMDGAPYISASVDYAVDPRTGHTNVGMRRLMLRGPREAGIDLTAPSDLRAMYEAAAAAGRRLAISFSVGAHPSDQVAATLRVPGDELDLVAALRGTSLPVVRCVTNDVRVPADAEWVLEGYLDERGHVESEGPYGEFLGYYGVVKRNPVFHLTAITRRRDALFQTATIGGHGMARTDTATLGCMLSETTAWRALRGAVREPVAVCATASSGGILNVRVALRQRAPGEARNAIAAVFGSLVDAKNVFVVDPDVDIFSDEQMDWALATRFQPDRDLVIASGLRAIPLDPSLPAGSRVGAKAGYDLTWPFGSGARLATTVPVPPRLGALGKQASGERFPSVRAALEDGPKYFVELMAALDSRDGREIVRDLDALRRGLGLDRDENGRYLIPSPPTAV